MASATREKSASLDDLLHVEGKAELIDGKIVISMPGHEPSLVAAEIFVSLRLHVRVTGRGFAYPDGMVFAVLKMPNGRQSFSPDASYYDGPPPINKMRYVVGPPTFAVEVRSEGDYGASAEVKMAAKRADYFLSGTLVVWDVDPLARLIRVFRAGSPTDPISFPEGQIADAEPAVPGWRMAVAEAFP